MKTPAWSGLRVSFGAKVRAAFFTVTVFGSLIRIDNVFTEAWSFVLYENKLVNCFTFHLLSVSSVELTFLSAIFCLAALGVFLYALPRDIQTTTSREDYVKRSIKALNALNISEWLHIYFEQNEKSGPVALRKVISYLSKYKAYCDASAVAGRDVNFDKTFKSHTIKALQSRYNHYSNENGFWLRRMTFGLLIFSSIIGGIAIGDAIIQTLYVIFTNEINYIRYSANISAPAVNSG